MVDAELSAMAASVCPADPRTVQQRRVDAFEALVVRRDLECRCETSDCPKKSEPAPPTSSPRISPKVVLNVIATADTVNGHSQAPGYLAGFGVIDAELVRELARDATRRLIEEPAVSQTEALRYRPGAALARWIRLRDLTCRAPGCAVPAEQCDIDHIDPFNHHDPAAGGHTVPMEPRLLLPGASPVQDLRRLVCRAPGRRHHRVDLSGGQGIAHHTRLRRPVRSDRSATAPRRPHPGRTRPRSDLRTPNNNRGQPLSQPGRRPRDQRPPLAQRHPSMARSVPRPDQRAGHPPRPTCSGSTIRSNPKSCSPVGNRHHGHRPIPTNRHRSRRPDAPRRTGRD